MKKEKINKYCEIVLDKSWSSYSYRDCKGYFRGYLYNPFLEKVEAAEYLTKHLMSLNNESISEYLNSLRGHYAFILEKTNEVVACVDIGRSIPLSYLRHNNKTYIFSNAEKIIDNIVNNNLTVSQSSALSIAMSGCTIGRNTLFHNIKNLNAGEFIHVDKINLRNHKWYEYMPTDYIDKNRDAKLEKLDEILNTIFENIIESCAGKKILVPLSAGLDSRLIASFLKKKNYKNVCCFSYGQKGNFEAYHAKNIARKLGLKWFFIEINYKTSKKYYESKTYKEYIKFSDSLASFPVSHELIACDYLKKKGFKNDTVIINGMAGDFFTSGHIPLKFTNKKSVEADVNLRKKFILDNYIEKHFSLWESLKTPNNIKLIKDMLSKQLSKFDLNSHDSKFDYKYHEYLEFMNRQSKIVMSNQRVYDFYNFGWRMPYFDYDFIDYWRNISIDDKISQNIFIDYLEKHDHGGVWKPIRKKTWVSPIMHRIIRPYLKILFFLTFNKKKWKNFDHKYLSYLNDVSKKNAIISWYDSIKDKRGARNANSWLVENYLKKFNISINKLI